jgi:hypothetical protein
MVFKAVGIFIMGCGLTNTIGGKFSLAIYILLLYCTFYVGNSWFCFWYLSTLCYNAYLENVLLQRSIEDKLGNLWQEKKNIEEEINRINPELQKVIL